MPRSEMPEDEEKYFPSTGHSFKLRRLAGKKIGPEIQLNLVHEWSSFINVFSPNYSPLSFSLSLRFAVGYSDRNSGFTRKAKKKERESHSDSHEYVTSVCQPRYFPLFERRERERKKKREVGGNFIDE